MKIIKLLDLCCKAGGAAMGYYQAACDLSIKIEIVGIDKDPQPNYPFTFIQSDAVEFLINNHKAFTHYHASPPCQQFSNSTAPFRAVGKKYIDILQPLSAWFDYIEKPCVIENVIQAPIRSDVVLRGDMFGLKVLKKRKFQLHNWFMLNPYMPKQIGMVKNGDYAQVCGKGQLKVTRGKLFNVEGNSIKEKWAKAMDINWMQTYNEFAEAIPPAYTRYIGNFFFKQ